MMRYLSIPALLLVALGSCKQDDPSHFVDNIHAEEKYFDSKENAIHDISFVSKDTGYAVGDSGLVLMTTNRGESWIKLNFVPETENLCAIDYVNGRSFLAGTVSYTSADFGANWNLVQDGPKFKRFAFGPKGSQRAYGIDIDNRIWRSLNKGTTWEELDGYPPLAFDQLEVFPSGTVVVTSPGGAEFASHDEGENWSLEEYGFPNAHVRDIIPNDTIFETYACGASFLMRRYGNVVQLGRIQGPDVDTLDFDSLYRFHEIYGYPDRPYMWAIGNRVVARSVDTGRTWTVVFDQNGVSLMAELISLCMIDDQTGFIGSADGRLYKFKD